MATEMKPSKKDKKKKHKKHHDWDATFAAREGIALPEGNGAADESHDLPAGQTQLAVDEAEDKGSNAIGAAQPKMSAKKYETLLAGLQIELVKLQNWVVHEGLRVAILFEGRDAAGKGGTIKRITESLNPRVARVVALPAPTEREKTQWYFQRYVAHLPAAGEIVIFDRSWYNRSGVERVMGFCTEEEYREFLRTCPEFERMLTRSGLHLIKYWFSVSNEEQERRFQGRITDPDEALEAEPDGPPFAEAVGRVFPGQGRDVQRHRHQASPVVRGAVGLQEGSPAQLHHTFAEPVPIRRSDARADRVAAPSSRQRLRPPADERPDDHPAGVLTGCGTL